MIVSSQVKLDNTIWGCSYSKNLNDKLWKLKNANPNRWCSGQSLNMPVKSAPNFNLKTSAIVSEKASNLLNRGPVKRGRIIEATSLFKREVLSPPGIAFASPEGKKLFSKGLPGGTSEQKWTHEGLITESLPNGMFRVRLDNQDVILGHVSGKIRRNNVRILPGDKVKIEVSRYDSTRGRIIYRLRSKDP